MSLHYWYMLPISILIATIAMASGVEGATFFSPLFILALRLPPDVAIGTGLITEVFGFASGLYAYTRKRFIDFRLGVMLLIVTIPMALLGTWVSGHVEPDILKTTLAVGLFAVAASFLRTPAHEEVLFLDRHHSTRNTAVRQPRPVWSRPKARRFATPSAIARRVRSSPAWAGCSSA